MHKRREPTPAEDLHVTVQLDDDRNRRYGEGARKVSAHRRRATSVLSGEDSCRHVFSGSGDSPTEKEQQKYSREEYAAQIGTVTR